MKTTLNATPDTKRERNPVGVAFLVIGIFAAFLLLVSDRRGGSKSASTDVNPYYLRTLCEHAVRDRLRSPATAIFNHDEPTLYSTTGTVDSQNGFGAMLRARFRCTFYGETIQNVDIR